MAIIRTFIATACLLCLSWLAPAFASAQSVYEVQTSSDDYVIVGTHDTGATMDRVVALARRLTGNPEITSADVIANLPHPRRFVCRTHGRQIYFGTDPEHAGRCPEDGVRADGLLAGMRYHIPRVHGVILPPPVRRTARVASEAPAADAVAREHFEALEQELDAVTAERDTYHQYVEEAETLILRANEAREEAVERAEAAEARPPRTVTVTVSAPSHEVTLTSLYGGRPLWGVMLTAAVLFVAIFLIFFGLVIRPRMLVPYARETERLTKERTKLEGEKTAHASELMEAKTYIKTLEKDLNTEVGKTLKLRSRIESLRAAGKRAIRMLVSVAADHRRLKEEHEVIAKRLEGFEDRREQIEEAYGKLAALRDQEEPFVNAQMLLREAEDARLDAEDRGDADAMKQLDEVIRLYQEHLESLGDPGDLRTEIAGLVAQLSKAMFLQCGIPLDARPADERLSEWEERRRAELRRTQAAGTAGLAELNQMRRALERDVIHKIGTAEGQAAAKVWKASLDKLEVQEALALERRTLSKFGQEVAGLRKQLADQQREFAELKNLLAATSGEPTEFATALFARDTRIGELELACREAGVDLSKGPRSLLEFWAQPQDRLSPVPPNGGEVRARVPTLTIASSEGERPSAVPGPSSPGNAINTALFRFLDTIEAMPPEYRILHSSEREVRDWAFFLAKWQVTVPAAWDGPDEPKQTREVPLRDLVKVVKRFFPEWVEERARRRTDPPGAPVPT